MVYGFCYKYEIYIMVDLRSRVVDVDLTTPQALDCLKLLTISMFNESITRENNRPYLPAKYSTPADHPQVDAQNTPETLATRVRIPKRLRAPY